MDIHSERSSSQLSVAEVRSALQAESLNLCKFLGSLSWGLLVPARGP